MSSLFDRIGLLLRSNITDLVASAEDPEKILNQLLIDMHDQFIQARSQVAVSIADEKRLEAKWADSKAAVANWEHRAMLAVKAGDDNLAQEALSHQQLEATQAAEWGKQATAQKEAADHLRAALVALNAKMEEAKVKKDLLIARAKRADATKTINKTMSSLNDNNSFDAFGRMADKVGQLEAEADAAADLNDTVSGASLDDKFKRLELDHGVGNPSDALLALKAKMGLLPSPTADAVPALENDTSIPSPVA